MRGCVYIWVVVDVGGVGCVFGMFTEQLHPTSNTVSFNGAWTDRRTDGRPVLMEAFFSNNDSSRQHLWVTFGFVTRGNM